MENIDNRKIDGGSYSGLKKVDDLSNTTIEDWDRVKPINDKDDKSVLDIIMHRSGVREQLDNLKLSYDIYYSDNLSVKDLEFIKDVLNTPSHSEDDNSPPCKLG